jgi:hypothetical protein
MLCSTSDNISCRVLTFRFQVPTRLSRFQLSSGSDIERYPTAAHQPQPNLISNSDWRRFKAVWEAHQKRIIQLLFQVMRESTPPFSFVPLSFPIIWTPSETTNIANIRASKEDIESPTHVLRTQAHKQIIWPSVVCQRRNDSKSS